LKFEAVVAVKLYMMFFCIVESSEEHAASIFSPKVGGIMLNSANVHSSGKSRRIILKWIFGVLFLGIGV
jgi:hypothetical protein